MGFLWDGAGRRCVGYHATIGDDDMKPPRFICRSEFRMGVWTGIILSACFLIAWFLLSGCAASTRIEAAKNSAKMDIATMA